MPRRGRIAIGFANERSPDGYFHKYGAFNIAGRIVPHDMMFGQNWVVKVRFSDRTGAPGRDREYARSPEGIADELRYIIGNPHQEILLKAFSVAGIDYGRADYAVVNDRVQIFEINTNPHLPYRPSPDGRIERLAIMERGLLDAIEAVNTPILARGRIRFKLPRPRAHNLQWPRRRLPISLARRAIDAMTRQLPGAIEGR